MIVVVYMFNVYNLILIIMEYYVYYKEKVL